MKINAGIWGILLVMFMLYFCMLRGFNEQTKALNEIALAIQDQNKILNYNPMDENSNDTKGNK